MVQHNACTVLVAFLGPISFAWTKKQDSAEIVLCF